MRIINLSALFAISLLLISPLFAKEPENIMLGVGIGKGQSKLSIEHSQFVRHPILGTGGGGTINDVPVMTARANVSSSSWALAWEFLFGYKHFINDFLGFRYYGNVGIQHYKSSMIQGQNSKEKIGLIDYTLNADLLFDFYTSDSFAVGIFAGVGFGGTSFDKNAINQYVSMYNSTEGIPIGATDITRHFFNVNASVGARIVFFQKISVSGGIRSCNANAQGRRVCGTPSSFIGHSLEFSAKFNIMKYEATDYDIMPSTDRTKYVSRPGYKVQNPYRITFRYIIEF